jgi:uracil-DNA glycosylase
MPPKKQPVVVDVDADEPKTSGKTPKRNFLADMAAQKAAKAGSMPEGVQQAGGAAGQSLLPYLTEPSWRAALAPLFSKPYMPKIESTIAAERAKGAKVFPPLPMVFSAFNECPVGNVKVVLIGQDPYHDNNQAHGMCFSVLPGVKTPPSLVNMYKELEQDIPGFTTPPHGYLGTWAEQGILLLNASLTVEAHKANSHSKIGWQNFTDDVISYLSASHTDLVFLLWGGFAQKKGKIIDRSRHVVIECAHPSPLSVTKWRGCKTFSKCNAALVAKGKEPIDWRLPATPPPVPGM